MSTKGMEVSRWAQGTSRAVTTGRDVSIYRRRSNGGWDPWGSDSEMETSGYEWWWWWGLSSLLNLFSFLLGSLISHSAHPTYFCWDSGIRDPRVGGTSSISTPLWAGPLSLEPPCVFSFITAPTFLEIKTWAYWAQKGQGQRLLL